MKQRSKRLLDRVRDAIRLKGYSVRTEEAYVDWIVSCEGVWASKEQRVFFLVTNKHIVSYWTLADGDILEYRELLQVSFYGGAGGTFTPVTVPLLDSHGDLLPSRLRLANDPNGGGMSRVFHRILAIWTPTIHPYPWFDAMPPGPGWRRLTGSVC